jgi:hypothetical protein
MQVSFGEPLAMEEIKYFFSYVRKDSEFVLKLAKELRASGVNVWLDQLDISGGQRWDHAVEGALATCQGMIAVLTPESLVSNNVMDEVSYALEEGKLVVPILLRSCTIPFRLRRVQYIDFTADYDTGFAQLLRALRIDQPSQSLKATVLGERHTQEETGAAQLHRIPPATKRAAELPRRVIYALLTVIMVLVVGGSYLLFWNSVKMIPPGVVTAESPSCDISGYWVHSTDGVGEARWRFTHIGDNRYNAQEEGLGGATGIAVLDKHHLRIDWKTDGYSGYYEWDINSDCDSGTGQLVFFSGGSGTGSSALNRGAAHL